MQHEPETEEIDIVEESGHTLDEIDIREIAARLLRDPRTVRRVARGEHVRGVAGAEIERAIRERIGERGQPRPRLLVLSPRPRGT
jgi:hypothetical protein